MTTHPTVSDRIGAAIKDTRARHGWTQDDLAGRCAALGAPHLTAAVIYDIESGRRNRDTGRRRREVSADDVFALALALDVAPLHLMVPLADDELVALTGTISERAQQVRQWARGHHPLKGTDRRIYYAYVPEPELARAEERAKLIEAAELTPEQFAGLIRVISESEGA